MKHIAILIILSTLLLSCQSNNESALKEAVQKTKSKNEIPTDQNSTKESIESFVLKMSLKFDQIELKERRLSNRLKREITNELKI